MYETCASKNVDTIEIAGHFFCKNGDFFHNIISIYTKLPVEPLVYILYLIQPTKPWP